MSDRICANCLLPIHKNERGLRHRGGNTLHSESRCIELLQHQLHIAQSGPLPWASHSRDLPVNPDDGRDYGHLAGDKPAPDAQVDPVVWMSRADWDNGREPSPVYSQPQAGDDVPLYARTPDADRDYADMRRMQRLLIAETHKGNALREAARMALEALERPNQGLRPVNGEWRSVPSLAIDALREALGDEE